MYELVGRKPVLLRALIERALIERAISGADGPVAPEDRDYVREMRAEPDVGRKLERYAAAMREIHGRMAPLLLALRDAAATEPDAAAVWAEVSERRAANMRDLAGELRKTGELRDDLDLDDVADTIWATNSPDLYLLLTRERGWNPERYERWLADSWQRLLLRR